MKGSILYQYRDMKHEADDISKRILKYRNAKGEIKDWAEIKALEEKYCELYKDLFNRQLEIENKINNLEPIERIILRYRYIDGMRWEKIFRLIHYSQKQTFRIHNNAIKKIK